jgi:hypothetical protein
VQAADWNREYHKYVAENALKIQFLISTRVKKAAHYYSRHSLPITAINSSLVGQSLLSVAINMFWNR